MHKHESHEQITWHRAGNVVRMILGHQVIGHISIDHDPKSNSDHLHTFEIEPEYRGRGYGSMLLDHTLQESRARYQYLMVSKDNRVAVAMYLKRGFKWKQLSRKLSIMKRKAY